MSRFGFHVFREEPDYAEGETEFPDRWRVTLPHQCDSWDIVGDWTSGQEHENAVADLSRFIAEAQTALMALKMRKESGKDVSC